MILSHEVAGRIRARREELGKTATECAIALGKSHAYWGHFENRKVEVGVDLGLVAQVLECSVEDLTNGDITRGVCRACGCTHWTPCVITRGRASWRACAWTDQDETLCTFCVHEETQEIVSAWRMDEIELERGVEIPDL